MKQSLKIMIAWRVWVQCLFIHWREDFFSHISVYKGIYAHKSECLKSENLFRTNPELKWSAVSWISTNCLCILFFLSLSNKQKFSPMFNLGQPDVQHVHLPHRHFNEQIFAPEQFKTTTHGVQLHERWCNYCITCIRWDCRSWTVTLPEKQHGSSQALF